MPAKRNRKTKLKQAGRFAFLGCLRATAFLFLAIMIFVLILEAMNIDKIAYGAELANIKLGGIKYEQAEEILKEKFNQFLNSPLEVSYKDQTWRIAPIKLGLKLDAQKNLESIYQLGRNKNIFRGIKEQIMAIMGKEKKSIIYNIDQEKFNSVLDKTFQELETPPCDAAIVYNSGHFETKPPKQGIIVDKKDFKRSLKENISTLDSQKRIFLRLRKKSPSVNEAEAEKAKQKARIILEKAPFEIKSEEDKWSIGKEIIAEWIEAAPKGDVKLNKTEIKNFLSTLAPLINQEPIDAQLTFSDGRVTVFTLSQNGFKLNLEQSAEKIEEKILDSIQTPPRPISLAIDKIPPTISINSINNLGITSFLAKGVSNFAGSPKNRMHNIAIGASKFDGIIIPPKEEFSFNKILGKVGPAQGYLPELVIKKDKTVPEYGGGLCQVSTTAFRAAINAGLKITERYSHAFPVSYYNPQGFDATIYPPHPDLRFINDTPSNLLIQTKIKGTQLIFEFYGTDDGREVKIKGPYITEQKKDGSMKTVLTQEIYHGEELTRKETFYSHYRSPDLYPIQRNPLE